MIWSWEENCIASSNIERELVLNCLSVIWFQLTFIRFEVISSSFPFCSRKHLVSNFSKIDDNSKVCTFLNDLTKTFLASCYIVVFFVNFKSNSWCLLFVRWLHLTIRIAIWIVRWNLMNIWCLDDTFPCMISWKWD